MLDCLFDPQFEIHFTGREQPGSRGVGNAVADICDHRLLDLAALLDDRENVAENLAGMLVIGQGIDRRHA